MDDHELSIVEISCGIPPTGINTRSVPQVQLLFQDTYNYSCVTGYETNDDITTECLANGSLSLANLPNCKSELKLTYSFSLNIII